MVAADDLDQRLLLRRVERQALLVDPRVESVEQRVRVAPVRAGRESVEDTTYQLVRSDGILKIDTQQS